jgi:NitT/TauT family transport system substrate-binding protein
VQQKIPTIAIAAIFQKDPQVLLVHPDRGINTFADLKQLNILVSSEGTATYYPWLKSEHGFTDAQVRPYTFNPQPFLVNKNVAMQGYVTSEPYVVEREGKFKPKIFLLADHGFDTYSTTIETRTDLIEKNPGLVQRFVDASLIGWYNYLYGDNKAANELIKKHNPEMTDDLIAYSIDKMKEYGIVDSGDARTLGIGAMTEARIKSFHDKMLKAGVIKPGLDWQKAFTTQFVNKKVGLELRPK